MRLIRMKSSWSVALPVSIMFFIGAPGKAAEPEATKPAMALGRVKLTDPESVAAQRAAWQRRIKALSTSTGPFDAQTAIKTLGDVVYDLQNRVTALEAENAKLTDMVHELSKRTGGTATSEPPKAINEPPKAIK